MAKAVSVVAHRLAGPFNSGKPLTSPGGLVQRGSYAATRQIHIMSRARPVFPIKASKVGGTEPKLPKDMA